MEMNLIIPINDLSRHENATEIIENVETNIFKEVYKSDLIFYPRDLEELYQVKLDLESIIDELEIDNVEEFNGEKGIDKILELQDYWCKNTI